MKENRKKGIFNFKIKFLSDKILYKFKSTNMLLENDQVGIEGIEGIEACNELQNYFEIFFVIKI